MFRNVAVVSGACAALSAALLATPSNAQPNSNDGRNRWVNVSNYTDDTVRNVYYGVPGRPYYRRDLLGRHMIGPYGDMNVVFDDGSGRCVYRIKAVATDGGYWERTVNVCETEEWSLHD